MKTSTPTVVSALTARTQLGQILRRVTSKNERFVVGRRGEPQAVIMSIRDYMDIVAPEPEWLAKIGEASKKRGTDTLTSREIDAIVTQARQERRAKLVRR